MKLEVGPLKIETNGELLSSGSEALLKLIPGRKIVSIARAKAKTEKIFTECVNDIVAEGKEKGWSDELISWRVQSAAEDFGKRMNLEEIVNRTVPLLDEGKNLDEETVDAIDSEWMNVLVNHAESASNEDMRSIVAAILAGEVNRPGSYSKGTVSTLARMDANQVKMFRQVCEFIVMPGRPDDKSIVPTGLEPALVLNKDTDGYAYADGLVTYACIMELEVLGLLSTNSQRSYAIREGVALPLIVDSCYALLGSPEGERRIDFPIVLTRTGVEFSQLFPKRNVEAIHRQLDAKAKKENLQFSWVMGAEKEEID